MRVFEGANLGNAEVIAVARKLDVRLLDRRRRFELERKSIHRRQILAAERLQYSFAYFALADVSRAHAMFLRARRTPLKIADGVKYGELRILEGFPNRPCGSTRSPTAAASGQTPGWKTFFDCDK